MANPQLEDGYTQIANELIAAFCLHGLAPQEGRLLWGFIRLIYGRKNMSKDNKWVSINFRELEVLVNMTPRQIREIKHRLLKKKLLFKKDFNFAVKYTINKDYNSWIPPVILKLKKHAPTEREERIASRKKTVSVDAMTVSVDAMTVSVDAEAEKPLPNKDESSAKESIKESIKEKIKTLNTLSSERPQMTIPGIPEPKTFSPKSEIKPLDLSGLWNKITAGVLPAVQEINDKRKRQIIARLKETQKEPDQEGYWRNVITKIVNNPFCCGDNDRGWRADFDYLLKPGTRIKSTEGSLNRVERVRKPSIQDSNMDNCLKNLEEAQNGNQGNGDQGFNNLLGGI